MRPKIKPKEQIIKNLLIYYTNNPKKSNYFTLLLQQIEHFWFTCSKNIAMIRRDL